MSNIFLDANCQAATAYVGCALFTSINPVGAAVLAGTASLTTDVTSKVFNRMFNKDKTASGLTKVIGILLANAAGYAVGMKVAAVAGFVFSLKTAIGVMFLSNLVTCAIALAVIGTVKAIGFGASRAAQRA